MVQNEVNLQQERISYTEQTTTGKVGESGGGKISSRHLRRRTGSHKRRRRHRFPQGVVQSSVGGMDEPPDVPQKSDQQEQDQEQQRKKKETPQKQMCRRARRKPALLKQSHSGWWQQPQEGKQKPDKDCEHTTDKAHWIPTHLWHAKRFHISTPIFSWSIPLMNANRGSRASLRLATSQMTPKCTIQDATWEIDGSAIILQASPISNGNTLSNELLVNVLRSVLEKITDLNCLSDKTITSGHRIAEGLIYEIDSFPAGLVGPASFMFKSMNNDTPKSEVHLSIFVHPAIRSKFVSILNTLVGQYSDSDINVSVSTEPYSLLRVRGTSSAAAVADVLSFNWDDISNHVGENGFDHGSILLRPQIILKCHQPNQHNRHLPQNLACSGWDILCHPSIGNDLFQRLVRQGGSCAVGLVEDARAQLEADPPLPIFPRDYPDSVVGRVYWEGSSAIQNDWALIRSCIEGSWGRNKTLFRRHRKEGYDRKASAEESSKVIMNSNATEKKTARIYWSHLVSPSYDKFVIVVRGSFGIPFLQLLHGCGRLHRKSDSNRATQTRRPRRPVRPSNAAVNAPSLSKAEKEAHSKLCQKLKASLSLPALLRCELIFDGKGSPAIGDIIYTFSPRDNDCGCNSSKGLGNESHLGLVIAGGFSPTRGRSYGVAFVSAAMFIEALDGTEHGMVKDERMFLKVDVAKGHSPRHLRRCALLSLLL